MATLTVPFYRSLYSTFYPLNPLLFLLHLMPFHRLLHFPQNVLLSIYTSLSSFHSSLCLCSLALCLAAAAAAAAADDDDDDDDGYKADSIVYVN